MPMIQCTTTHKTHFKVWYWMLIIYQAYKSRNAGSVQWLIFRNHQRDEDQSLC